MLHTSSRMSPPWQVFRFSKNMRTSSSLVLGSIPVTTRQSQDPVFTVLWLLAGSFLSVCEGEYEYCCGPSDGDFLTSFLSVFEVEHENGCCSTDEDFLASFLSGFEEEHENGCCSTDEDFLASFLSGLEEEHENGCCSTDVDFLVSFLSVCEGEHERNRILPTSTRCTYVNSKPKTGAEFYNTT